jgi:hypothetical protein
MNSPTVGRNEWKRRTLSRAAQPKTTCRRRNLPLPLPVKSVATILKCPHRPSTSHEAAPVGYRGCFFTASMIKQAIQLICALELDRLIDNLPIAFENSSTFGLSLELRATEPHGSAVRGGNISISISISCERHERPRGIRRAQRFSVKICSVCAGGLGCTRIYRRRWCERNQKLSTPFKRIARRVLAAPQPPPLCQMSGIWTDPAS